MTDDVEWRDVVGWEGCYRVSSDGRVKSVPRTVRRAGRLGPTCAVRGRYLRPTSSTRYPVVALYRDGVSATRSVHVLVAEAFYSPRPEGSIVRHLDDDSRNNSLANLCYGTPAENRADAVRNGRDMPQSRTHCPADHEYSPENTYVYRRADGSVERHCRECGRLSFHRRNRERNS